MTKKIIALLLVLVLCAAAACYFLLPRPVIQDPENAAIQYIVIQKDPYYQEDASDYYLWEPKSEGDRAVEREILAYLAQSQETRTLRTNTDPDTYPPLTWKCMYILVDTDPGDTATTLEERGILLGPTQFQEGENPAQYEKAVNISYNSAPGPGLLGRFNGDLADPDGIRAFVLNALDLPADFL